jgi:MYXO-CTERM domain-containing protein
MRRARFLVSLASFVVCVSISPLAFAGQLSVQGNVTLLDDVDQLDIVVGTADFNQALAPIPFDFYAAEGMTLHEGSLDAILPGVTEPGTAVLPFFFDLMGGYFPGPIAGDGVSDGAFNLFGGVATFSDPITQFGAVGSTEGPQYITVWDQNGVMLGQVSWVPNADAAFFGIDTNGVPIGMLAYGSDDVWSGVPYTNEDGLFFTDTWMWAVAVPCQSDADCADDGDNCTDEVCIDGFCDYPFNVDPCDDGNACTQPDACSEGECLGVNSVDPCDDGDACTEQDACSEGECVAVDVDCDDGDLCTIESCDMLLGCVYEDIAGCCLTDEDCADGEICLVGSNSCIPDQGGDGDGDTGDGDGETGDGDGDPGDGDGDPGDGDGDPGDGDTGDGDGGSSEESGGDTGSDAGGPIDESAGCACASGPSREGALLGLLGLFMLGTVRTRKRLAN